MNLLHLKYAVEIAQTRSISKAAANLYMSQPNLSRAIRELEESLGVTLFKRTSKGIEITPDGEEFLGYANKILAQVASVENMYTQARTRKQTLSVCVPRASYMACALTKFAAALNTDEPAEIFYKETNSMRTIQNVVKMEYDMGIVRYQSAFDRYFKQTFEAKGLVSELITEFSYVLLISEHSPLATSPTIQPEDLASYIEVTHGDPYVPSMPTIDVKKAELSEYVDKRIFIFERASQFSLLSEVPNTFMWVSPVPESMLQRYGLVQRQVDFNKHSYRDVLIHRKHYTLTDLDRRFITELCNARRQYV